MIVPDKYTDLRTSTLSVAAELLRKLFNERICPLSEAEKSIEDRLGTESVRNIPEAIALLFLLGLLEYESAMDTIQLVGLA